MKRLPLSCAGVANGTTIRMPGMGGPVPKQFQGQGGDPGDLLLEIDVEPSRVFRREGQDIVVSRDIDFTDAILGIPLR
jgi:molecular chaperone DnaJ